MGESHGRPVEVLFYFLFSLLTPHISLLIHYPQIKIDPLYFIEHRNACDSRIRNHISFYADCCQQQQVLVPKYYIIDGGNR